MLLRDVGAQVINISWHHYNCQFNNRPVLWTTLEASVDDIQMTDN